MRLSFCLFLLLAAFSPCFGNELVYFTSGFSIEIQSHSANDQALVCTTSTGTLEFPLSDIARIESVPGDPPAAPSSLAAIPTRELLSNAARRQGLPPELVRSVAKIESGLRQSAVSSKGAIGLMQLMPQTAAQLGVEPNLPEQNAQGGARYLRDLLVRYHYDSALALAAYNAGPAAVDKYRGVPPYAETRQYVLKVLHEYEREHRLQAQTPHPPQ